MPHVYNTRAIWALAAMGVVANETGFLLAARRNLDWALTQQTPSGWFATNAFVPGRHPFTHTIAYAIRGFIEVAVLLGEERYLRAAENAARGLMAKQRSDGWLAGTYGDGWTSDGKLRLRHRRRANGPVLAAAGADQRGYELPRCRVAGDCLRQAYPASGRG